MEEFENKFKSFVNSKYCISTNNGTDALILSLKALNIGKGDEVITVCNSFYATAGAIAAVGAKIVFVDCDDRYQIDINDIKKKNYKKDKSHNSCTLGRRLARHGKNNENSKKNKLYVIEDACMGIGGKLGKKHPGTFGDIGAFSMHPLKSLNVMGDGGAIVTDNKKLINGLKCIETMA